VSWVSRLLGRKRQISVAEIADVLAGGILRGAADLAPLVEQVASALDEEGLRLRNADVHLECLLFEWFITDTTVVEEFPRHSRQVCPAIALRVAREAEKDSVGIEGVRRTRSVEYAAAASGGMNSLCGIAARQMLTGEVDDPFPTALHLSHQLVARLLYAHIGIHKQHLSGIGRKFEIANS
jgi:hypothetical protein